MRPSGAAAVLAAAIGLAACGSSAPTSATTRSAPRPAATTAASTTAAPPRPTPKPKPRPKPKPKLPPNQGRLPQTHQLPSASTPGFHAEMQALWTGISQGRVRPAMPAFFPEAAYAQVKQIADPQGDWTDRLVGDYRLDIDAAHALLAGRPARLVGVQVPQSYAHWVDPGACYNGVGYYEVPNARVVYRQGGEIHSFGIASMISWRGVWYVVHLGAIVRPGGGGVVDDPSPGTGTSVPSDTC